MWWSSKDVIWQPTTCLKETTAREQSWQSSCDFASWIIFDHEVSEWNSIQIGLEDFDNVLKKKCLKSYGVPYCCALIWIMPLSDIEGADMKQGVEGGFQRTSLAGRGLHTWHAAELFDCWGSPMKSVWQNVSFHRHLSALSCYVTVTVLQPINDLC